MILLRLMDFRSQFIISILMATTNENGANVVEALSSEYAKQYRAAVKGTHDKYCMFSDVELIKEINQKALQLIRGEQNVF